MHVSWKAFWAAVTGSVTISAGLVVWLVDVPWWLVAPAGLGVGAVAALAARVVVHRAKATASLRYSSKVAAVRWITGAALAHVALLTAFVAAPASWPLWLAMAGTFAGAEYWIARALEYHAHLPAPAPVAPVVDTAGQFLPAGLPAGALPAPEHVGVPQVDPRTVAEAILATAGLGWLRVLDLTDIGPNGADGFSIIAATPTRRERGAGSKIEANAAEEVAIASQAILRRPIRRGWVQINAAEAYGAGTHRIAVVVRDVLADVRPLPLDLTPTSLDELCQVGYGIDGSPVQLWLRQHGQVIGQTGTGKSALVVVMLVFTIRAGAVNWVCGSQKLLDLVGPFLRPYADRGEESPIPYVAAGMADSMDMLLLAAEIIQWRQKLPPEQRHRLVPIRLTLDEAQRVLENRNPTHRRFFDGRWHFATDLYAYIHETGRSAGVFATSATQHGLHGKHGDKGSDIQANRGFVAVFGSGDHSEIGRQLGYDKWKAPRPPHIGTCWLDRGVVPANVEVAEDDDPTQRLFLTRVLYGQEPAPMKKLHDGPTISEISWGLRDLVSDLDDETAAFAATVAEGIYARRITDAAELLAYVQAGGELDDDADYDDLAAGGGEGVPAARQPMSIEEEARQVVAEQMVRFRAEAGLPPAPGTESPAAASAASAAETSAPRPGVAVLADRRNRTDYIVEIVRDAPGPISTAEITTALLAAGYTVTNQNALTNTLSDLVRAGRIGRPAKGVYVPGGAA